MVPNEYTSRGKSPVSPVGPVVTNRFGKQPDSCCDYTWRNDHVRVSAGKGSDIGNGKSSRTVRHASTNQRPTAQVQMRSSYRRTIQIPVVVETIFLLVGKESVRRTVVESPRQDECWDHVIVCALDAIGESPALWKTGVDESVLTHSRGMCAGFLYQWW